MIWCSVPLEYCWWTLHSRFLKERVNLFRLRRWLILECWQMFASSLTFYQKRLFREEALWSNSEKLHYISNLYNLPQWNSDFRQLSINKQLINTAGQSAHLSGSLLGWKWPKLLTKVIEWLLFLIGKNILAMNEEKTNTQGGTESEVTLYWSEKLMSFWVRTL